VIHVLYVTCTGTAVNGLGIISGSLSARFFRMMRKNSSKLVLHFMADSVGEDVVEDIDRDNHKIAAAVKPGKKGLSIGKISLG